MGQLSSSDCIGSARTTRGCKTRLPAEIVVHGVSNLPSERFGHHHVSCFAKACAPQTGLKLYAGGKGEEGRNEGANCATRKYWCSKVARGPRSSNGLKRQVLSRLHASFKVKSGARKGRLQIGPPKKQSASACARKLHRGGAPRQNASACANKVARKRQAHRVHTL